jgi:hypothetical protein
MSPAERAKSAFIQSEGPIVSIPSAIFACERAITQAIVDERERIAKQFESASTDAIDRADIHSSPYDKIMWKITGDNFATAAAIIRAMKTPGR